MAGSSKRLKTHHACSALLGKEPFNPEQFWWVCHFTEQKRFLYMGRALTKRLLEFVENQTSGSVPNVAAENLQELYTVDPGQMLNTDDAQTAFDEYGFHYVTGIPGTGKTWSLRTVVVYLYGKFSAAREEARNGASNKDPEFSAARMGGKVPDKDRRILMLEGAGFAEDPAVELRTAMFQAYSDTKAALDDIDDLTDGRELVSYLAHRVRSGECITIVVDDGNKLVRKGEGVGYLRSLCWTCKIVFCASVSPEWLNVIRHPKTEHFMLVVDGLKGKELDSYMSKLTSKSDIIDTKATGTNPRLLNEYATNPDMFRTSTMDTFRQGIGSFMETKLLARQDFRRDLTGTVQVPLLTDFLETRCFYRGDDETLQCVTDELRSVTLMDLAQRIDKQGLDEQVKEVMLWVDPVSGDDNMIRIGWNAEMAAILAMKFFDTNVYYDTGKFIPFRTKHVNRFPGEMSKIQLRYPREDAGTLHLPMKATHAGVDAYYEDDKYIVAVQITVARNPEDHHDKAVPKAEELFHGDKRIKVLLWIVYTDRWCSYFVDKAHLYYYVTMPFGDLSQTLGRIDDRLRELRGRPRQEDFCWSCFKADGGDTSWIQCDFCDLYYHQKCVSKSSFKARQVLQRGNIRVLAEGKWNSADPSLRTALPPFECSACSGKIKVSFHPHFESIDIFVVTTFHEYIRAKVTIPSMTSFLLLQFESFLTKLQHGKTN